MNANQCPKCRAIIRHVMVEDITMNSAFVPRFKGFSYGCPSCKAVLGVEVNHLALKEELLNEVAKMLGRPR